MKIRLLNISASLIYAFSQWLQIIIITNYLGMYDVGMFTLIIAILGPIILFSRYSFFSLMPTENRYNFSVIKYKNARSVFNFSFLIIIIILILLLNIQWYFKICLGLYSIFKYFESKEEFIYIENVLNNNLKFVAYSKIIKSVTSIIAFFLFIYLTKSLLFGIIGLIFSQILVYNFIDKKHSDYNQFSFSISKREFTLISKLGFSLTFVSLLISLSTNIPRYVIESYHDTEMLGIYATLLYTIVLINNVTITLNTTFIVDFSNSLKKGLNIFKNRVLKIFILYFSVGIITFLLVYFYGSSIFSAIYGQNYYTYEYEISLLALYILLTIASKYMEMILNVLNAYKAQVKLHMTAFILTLVLSFLFIPTLGLTGAIMVNVVVFVIIVLMQLMMILFLTRKVKKH